MFKDYKTNFQAICLFTTLVLVLLFIHGNLQGQKVLQREDSEVENRNRANLSAPFLKQQIDIDDTEGGKNAYQMYCWKIELSLAKYQIDRINYKVRQTYIPNSSGSASPLIGEFQEDELMAYFGNLYTRFGDIYYQYYNFMDFKYISVIYEMPNAEKFLTPEYANENEFAYDKLKQIRGDNFQFYDPKLTVYEKKEYILVNDSLFLLSRDNKMLIEQDKEENDDFKDLMLQEERIVNTEVFPIE